MIWRGGCCILHRGCCIYCPRDGDVLTHIPDLGVLTELIEGLLSDETYERDKNSITTYSFRATNTVDYFTIASVSKIAAAVLAIVLLYAVLGIWISGKKLALGSIALVLTVCIISGVIFRREIATMASVKEYAPGMYTCNITND